MTENAARAAGTQAIWNAGVASAADFHGAFCSGSGLAGRLRPVSRKRLELHHGVLPPPLSTCRWRRLAGLVMVIGAPRPAGKGDIALGCSFPRPRCHISGCPRALTARRSRRCRRGATDLDFRAITTLHCRLTSAAPSPAKPPRAISRRHELTEPLAKLLGISILRRGRRQGGRLMEGRCHCQRRRKASRDAGVHAYTGA